MKKLLLILSFFCFYAASAQYNPSVGKVPINTAIGINYAGSLDSRSMFYDEVHFTSRAYVDTAEVWNYLNQAKYRSGFFPIIVNTGGTLSNGVITGGTNALWIYLNGTARNNLVPLNSGSVASIVNVGSGYRLVTGVNGVKTIIPAFGIKIDTIVSGLVRITFDSSLVYANFDTTHPFVMKVDPAYFQVLGVKHDSLTCIGCGSGGGTATSFLVYSTDSVKSHKPADGTIYITLNYKTSNDNGGASYVYVASSTTTGNDMTVLTPTAGGTGRWFLRYPNGEVTLPQVGIFPSTDNTTQMNAISALSASKFTIRPWYNSTYVIDANAGGITPISHVHFKGYTGSTFIAKAYTNLGGGKAIFFYYSATIPIVDYSVDGIILDGNTLYDPTTHAIASGSPVKDSLSSMISVNNTDSVSVTYCAFQNGGNYDAFRYFKSTHLTLDYNTFTKIGSPCGGSDFDSSSHYISVRHNKFYSHGLRYLWETLQNNRREGNIAFQGGGDNFYYEYNEDWNADSVMCFTYEGINHGNNVNINYNIVHSMGKNYGGYSVQGTHAVRHMTNLTMIGNTNDGVLTGLKNHKDSIYYIAGTNSDEFANANGGWITGGVRQGYQCAVSGDVRNFTFNGVTINDSVVNATSFPGGGANIFYTTGNTVGDSIINFNVNNCNIVVGGGELLRVSESTPVINGFHFNSNTNIAFLNAFSLTLGEIINCPTGGVHTGITYENNPNVSGQAAICFYTTSATGAPIAISLNGTNFSKTNVDSIANLYQNNGGPATVFTKIGSIYNWGVFNKYMDSISATGTNVVGWRNGQAKWSFVAPGGGGGYGPFDTVSTLTTQYALRDSMNVVDANYNGAVFSSGDTLTLFGTSITLGTGASTTVKRYSSVICAAQGAIEKNLGVAGSTVMHQIPYDYQGALSFNERWSTIPAYNFKNKFFSIEGGPNDAGQTAAAYTTANYRLALDSLINHILNTKGWPKSRVGLTGVSFVNAAGFVTYAGITSNAAPTRARFRSFDSTNKAAAMAWGIRYIPWYQKVVDNDTTLLNTDGIHPIDSGYAYMANQWQQKMGVYGVSTTGGGGGSYINNSTTVQTADFNINGKGIFSRGTGSHRDTKIYAASSLDDFSGVTVKPNAGTNVAAYIGIEPLGTGLSSIKSSLYLFGTDFTADNTNYEGLLLTAAGLKYDLHTIFGGSGVDRPLNIFNGSNTTQATWNTDGTISFGNKLLIGATGTPDEVLHVKAAAGNTIGKFENTNSASYEGPWMYNDIGLASRFFSTGSTFSAGLFNSSSTNLVADQSGGFNFVAGISSASMRFYAGGYTTGDEKLRLDATGPKFTLGSDATGDIWYRNSSGYFTRLAIGTAAQHLVGGTIPHWVDTAASGAGGVVAIRSTTANGRTGTATDVYTTPNDATVHSYNISVKVNITAITAGALTVTVDYTDNATNTGVTNTYYSMGATTAAMSTTGASNFPIMDVGGAKPNTTITVTATFTGSSITYNYLGTFIKLF